MNNLSTHTFPRTPHFFRDSQHNNLTEMAHQAGPAIRYNPGASPSSPVLCDSQLVDERTQQEWVTRHPQMLETLHQVKKWCESLWPGKDLKYKSRINHPVDDDDTRFTTITVMCSVNGNPTPSDLADAIDVTADWIVTFHDVELRKAIIVMFEGRA